MQEEKVNQYLKEIINTMNEVAETLQPDAAAQAVYEQLLPLFEASYQALLPIRSKTGSSA